MQRGSHTQGEAFSRVVIDEQLRDVDWNLTDGQSVRYEHTFSDGLGPDNTGDAGTRIKRFKSEEFPQIMVSVNMLDTGFDHPETVNLVMARFTKSAILYRQMRGRGTRRADHIKKTHFTMFDFVGVTGPVERCLSECRCRSSITPPKLPLPVLRHSLADLDRA